MIHYFKNLGKQCGVDDVQAMYIKLIDSLKEIDISLPLERRTFNVLHNEIIKLKKDFDDKS